MARKGVTYKTMYTTPETETMFQVVKDHYGNEYSTSEVLTDLVRKKYQAIQEGSTRRQIVSDVHADVTALTAIVEQMGARMSAMEKTLQETTRRLLNVLEPGK